MCPYVSFRAFVLFNKTHATMFSIAQVLGLVLAIIMNDTTVSQSVKLQEMQSIQQLVNQDVTTLSGTVSVTTGVSQSDNSVVESNDTNTTVNTQLTLTASPSTVIGGQSNVITLTANQTGYFSPTDTIDVIGDNQVFKIMGIAPSSVSSDGTQAVIMVNIPDNETQQVFYVKDYQGKWGQLNPNSINGAYGMITNSDPSSVTQ